MANVDLTRFPELRPLMQQRDQQASLIRMRQQLDPMGGDHFCMAKVEGGPTYVQCQVRPPPSGEGPAPSQPLG